MNDRVLHLASTIDARTRRVLVADDDAALVRSLARVLARAGYDVVTALDGGEALAAIERGAIDVVVSDIHMPIASGLDLLRVARERDLDLPVVLMTGDPRVESAAEAVELGACRYLTKPVPVDLLLESVERAATRGQRAREAARPVAPRMAAADELRDLDARFDRALESMWVAFQPIVESGGRRIFGYEALLRSEEPALPHPGAVLGAAERLGRLPDLGRRVRTLVAASADRLPGEQLLFVNVHTHDLLDPLLSSPEEPLSKIAPRVVLEVTERSPIDSVADVHARVGALRALGFRIAIDDLGAGYAGLTAFALLEPEFVKLDMSLVRNVHASPIRRKLIASMTSLCREMGMQVVAEGIESVDERDAILALGCDLLQGFLLGRPGRAFAESTWP